MEEVYRLAQSGENNDLKMQIVALEYRTRLLLERCNKVGLNWIHNFLLDWLAQLGGFYEIHRETLS